MPRFQKSASLRDPLSVTYVVSGHPIVYQTSERRLTCPSRRSASSSAARGPNRFADKPAEWIAEIAKARGDIDVEIVDLRDYPMPFFDEAASPAWAPSQNEVAQNWQKKVAELDGFIFIAAEYNRGPTAVLKNALDYAYNEWNKKPVDLRRLWRRRRRARGRAAPPACRRAADGADAHGRPYRWGRTSSPSLQQGKKLEEFEHLNQSAAADARPARLVDEGAEGGARQATRSGRRQGCLSRQLAESSRKPGAAFAPPFRRFSSAPRVSRRGAGQARGDDLVDAAAVEVDDLEAPALRVDASRRSPADGADATARSRRRSRSRGSPAGRCRDGRPSRRPACSRRAAMSRPRAGPAPARPSSTSARNTPVIASRMSAGVTMPSKWPYSSWTSATGTSRFLQRRQHVERVGLVVHDRRRRAHGGADRSGLPASIAASTSRVWTTPTMASTAPSPAGSRECCVSISILRQRRLVGLRG